MEKGLSIQRALQILELPMDSATPFLRAPSYNFAVKALEEFKELVYKQRRLLSTKYHPDVYKGSDDKIKEINATVDLVKKTFINPPRPPIHQRINIIFHRTFVNSAGTSSTTYTSTRSF